MCNAAQRPNRPATLGDIARLARVSRSTVSRALAGSPLVSEQTRDRIRRLAEEHGYRANAIARSLVQRRTRTLGLVVPDVGNPYYPEIIDAALAEARSHGFSLALSVSSPDGLQEEASVEQLTQQQVEALIVVVGPRGLSSRGLLRRQLEWGTPVVLVGWTEDSEEFDAVFGDDDEGARRMVRHLASVGHRRIAMLAPAIRVVPPDRAHGFQTEMLRLGLWREGCILCGLETEPALREAIRSLLAAPEPPTALFAYQDLLAARAIQALGELGARVPEDVAVVGFDNLDLARYLAPPLTTVDQHARERARRAVRIALGRIGGDDAPPRRETIPTSLVVRSSCGASGSASFRSLRGSAPARTPLEDKIP
ncbi:MAG: LacI family transcriptional regulator [Fimbriimonadales bacterium]|nr:LacI family transcriptional regulator [Fimbriimonadales bacterium]